MNTNKSININEFEERKEDILIEKNINPIIFKQKDTLQSLKDLKIKIDNQVIKAEQKTKEMQDDQYDSPRFSSVSRSPNKYPQNK